MESSHSENSVTVSGQGAWRLASLVLFALLGFNILLQFQQYGMSWDEPFHYKWGEEKWAYYVDLWQAEDRWEVISKARPDVYPGFYDLTLVALKRISPWEIMPTSHLLTALFGLAGILAVWRTGQLLGGERLAFLCALFLVLMPRYYGHSWFNLKDIPFAVCHAWGIYFLLRVVQQLPRPSFRSLTAFGVAAGLTMGVRIGGLLLLCYLAVALGLYWLYSLWSSKGKAGRQHLVDFGRYVLYGGYTSILSYVVLIPWWPHVHKNPLLVPFQTLESVQSFPWEHPVLFDGLFYMSTALPFYYLPTWVLITTPILTLLAVGVGVFLALLWLLDRRREGMLEFHRPLMIGMLAFSFVFPVGYVMVRQPILYDGLRHFLFILPSLACLAALSVEGLLGFIRQARWRDGAAVAICCLLGISVVPAYWRLYPYEYIYFNSLVGGLEGAFRHYESEYYGLSYREAAETLAFYLESHEGVPEEPKKVMISGAPWLIEDFLPEYLQVTRNPAEADFYVSYIRLNQHMVYPGKIIGVVEREGVPLNYILDLRERF